MKKIISILLAIMLMLGTIPAVIANATDKVPEGYEGIYDIEDLYCIRYNLDKNYILMADIDLTEATAQGGDWDNNGYGWAPIAENETLAFSGIFDGNGHTIKGMQIRNIKTNYAGLFGYVTGEIKNLVLEDAVVSTNSACKYCGVVIAYSLGNISNVEVKNLTLTSASQYTSGVVGYYSASTVSNVKVSGSITVSCSFDKAWTGGLAGYICDESIIENCSDSAEISSNNQYYSSNSVYNYVGGIAGEISNSSIKKCFNLGKVTGVCFNNYGSCDFSKSFSYVGGISGYSSANRNEATICDCYNTGDAFSEAKRNYSCNSHPTSSTAYSGGILGLSIYSEIVKNCINIGNVTASATGAYRNYKYISSIAQATLDKNYYLNGTASYGKSETTDTATTAVALSAVQMNLKSVFGYLDFEDTWFIDTSTGINHPQLISNPECEYYHKHIFDQTNTDSQYLESGATCTQKAKYYYSCLCGEKGTETFEFGEIGNHIFNKTNTDGKYLATKATCQAKATYYYSCTCGEKGTDTFESGDFADHNYGEWITEESATYTSTGIKGHYCCSVCKKSFDNDKKIIDDLTIAILDHTFDQTNTSAKYLVSVATCKEKAKYYYSCTCGAKGSLTFESGDFASHTPGNWVVTTPPTADADGVESHYCSVCGNIYETRPVIFANYKVHSVQIDDLSLNYKSESKIGVSISVDQGVNYTMTYSSSDTNVATVDNSGKVKAIGRGEATITCTVTDQFGNVVSDTSTVTVNYSALQWIIIIVLFGWAWYI